MVGAKEKMIQHAGTFQYKGPNTLTSLRQTKLSAYFADGLFFSFGLEK